MLRVVLGKSVREKGTKMAGTELVSKDFFERIWEMKCGYIRARLYKWRNQRLSFAVRANSFPCKVIEDLVKDKQDLPSGHVVINGIFTGNVWRQPAHDEYGKQYPKRTVMAFRDILMEWTAKNGVLCSMMACAIQHRKCNKHFCWSFNIEEVLEGGLKSKRKRAGDS